MLHMIRSIFRGRVLVLAAIWAVAAGCENVEWNWDTTWWQKPKRVVKPSQRSTEDREPANAERSGGENRAAQRAPSGDALTQTQVAEPPPPAAESASRSPAGRLQGERGDRPFHQLYLSRTDSAADTERGERRLTAKHLRPRAWGSLIEMLYVPMGRSGSEDESYLIYENPVEFEAAAAAAAMLDAAAAQSGGSAPGEEGSFRAGVAAMAQVIDQGAVADRRLMDRCEAELAAALQSSRLPPLQRWAAGILAGRLASEYRYDYPSARSYYQQAQRAAEASSGEQMTAEWWIADSFVQEGRTAEAREAYETILASFGPKWGSSHVVRRAEAILRDRKSR